MKCASKFMKLAIVFAACSVLLSCKVSSVPDESQEASRAKAKAIKRVMEDDSFEKVQKKYNCTLPAEERKKYAHSNERTWNDQAVKHGFETPFSFDVAGDCAEALLIFNKTDPRQFVETNRNFLSESRQNGFKLVVAYSGPKPMKMKFINLSIPTTVPQSN
jgi:hypothetical protein